MPKAGGWKKRREPASEIPDLVTQTKCVLKERHFGTSLVVQWLGLPASTADGTGSIPVQGTKIPHAVRQGLK